MCTENCQKNKRDFILSTYKRSMRLLYVMDGLGCIQFYRIVVEILVQL